MSITTCPPPGHPISSLPPELLQHIFTYLDLPSLLRCQSVCTLWNACTPSTSPSIRAALFLPRPVSTLTTPPVTMHFTVDICAYFLDLYPYTEPPLSYSFGMSTAEVRRLAGLGVVVHPELIAGVADRRINYFVRGWKGLHGEAWRNEVYGSWMGMLVCWPPVSKIAAKFAYTDDAPVAGYVEYDLHAEEGEIVASGEEGVMLGEFMVRVQELVNIP
ncbi:hypothetical protein CC86DRAFT_399797 [Ophiobolus disseminans]|uniref:F-box domain-containing protein n=1 Tax=Ophiobolus disseminans TaxID=1469910 RepID=A0A6A7AIM1_9PLEO|nr:hypothetical protein CC86DRAFT_399797 [Ophiobolus disseminans]